MRRILCKMGLIVAAIAVSLAMGAQVFAAEGTDVPIKQFFHTNGDSGYSPATTFEYGVRSGSEWTYTEESNGATYTVVPGPAGGLYFAEGADRITFAQNDVKNLYDDVEGGAVKYTNLSVDKNVLTTPGIYSYNVYQKPVTGFGLSADDSVYIVNVYVSDDDNGELAYYYFIYAEKYGEPGVPDTSNPETNGKEENARFTNGYEECAPTVECEVTGDFSSQTDEFTWTVEVTSARSENAPIVMNGETQVQLQREGNKFAGTINVKHGEQIMILGLEEGDVYAVTQNENDIKAKGYIQKSATNTSLTMTSLEDFDQENFTGKIVNEKKVTPPTGVFMSNFPYILIGIITLIGAAFFLRRRNYDTYTDEEI